MIRVQVLRAALVSLLLPFPLHAAEMELRCSELGAACLMSEPMNTNKYVAVDANGGQAPGNERACADYTVGGWPYPVQPDVDFGDTEGPTAKQAGRALNSCSANAPVTTSGGPADAKLPSGSSGVNYVMRSNVRSAVMYHSKFGTGNKRICQRSYRKFSSNYSGSAVCGGDKNMEVWSQAGTAIQMQEWGTAGNFQFWTGAWSSSKDNVWSSPTVSFKDCQNNWCRFEMCISTTDASVNNLTNISVDAYATQVGVASPKTGKWSFFLGNSTSSLAEMWPYVTFRHNPPITTTCGDLDPAKWGYSYHTHAMVAGWPSNAGQFIGPATEVEGGTSGGGNPSPQPPLAAPVLLE